MRFLVDFVQSRGNGDLENSVYLDWNVQVKIEAIDSTRTVKAVPFLYLSKDSTLEAVPFGITLDKEETESDVKIHGVKVV